MPSDLVGEDKGEGDCAVDVSTRVVPDRKRQHLHARTPDMRQEVLWYGKGEEGERDDRSVGMERKESVCVGERRERDHDGHAKAERHCLPRLAVRRSIRCHRHNLLVIVTFNAVLRGSRQTSFVRHDRVPSVTQLALPRSQQTSASLLASHARTDLPHSRIVMPRGVGRIGSGVPQAMPQPEITKSVIARNSAAAAFISSV
eukprot:458986-Rhodomonas_salina.1